jgi:hypothetical protein
MSVSASRAPAAASAAETQSAEPSHAKPQGDADGGGAGGIHAQQSHGWMPHHGSTPVRAAQWFAATHRALPNAMIGLRAGGLMPPRGALVHHSASSSHKAGTSDEPDSKSRSSARGSSAEGEGLFDLGTEARRHIGSRGGHGETDSGTQGDDSERAALLAAVAVEEADARSLPTAGAALVLMETAPELDARLRQGEVCWASNLRLAMECAQMHPGADVFVQSFSVIDAEGNVIPAFGHRGRLRAGDGGAVHAYADLPHGAAASPAAAAQPDAALMQELESASLLALSLRPVVDENGHAQSALGGLVCTEIAQLRSLFERPLPAGMRKALSNAAQAAAARWREACAHADHEQRLALRGDVIEREVNEQRARLSTTIASQQGDAWRARNNWLRAQEQVRHWAAAQERLTWLRVAHLNRMLGEGLAPWNKPKQAERVGARYGELRRLDVVCGVPPQYFLRADQLPQAVVELFEWYEEQQRFDAPTFLVAAQMQQRLITLHPFVDANGRTARLAMDWILLQDGWPPALLADTKLALFPNEAAPLQPAPGVAERQVVQGLHESVELHLQWLRQDTSIAE